jgi:hypothetical protein
MTSETLPLRLTPGFDHSNNPILHRSNTVSVRLVPQAAVKSEPALRFVSLINNFAQE